MAYKNFLHTYSLNKTVNVRMATPGRIKVGNPTYSTQARPFLTSLVKALDHNVVNKIAAGEIIIAPVNALKELLENAVDARATSVDIIVKGGGLKLLQITDNGSGINVCTGLPHVWPCSCSFYTAWRSTNSLRTFHDVQAKTVRGLANYWDIRIPWRSTG